MLIRILILALMFAIRLPAQIQPEWKEPFPPHRIIGNVYYVGSKGLASYLITTPQGHMLINSNLESSVPQIKESVEKLGFKFSDVKILLIHVSPELRFTRWGAQHFVDSANNLINSKQNQAEFLVGFTF